MRCGRCAGRAAGLISTRQHDRRMLCGGCASRTSHSMSVLSRGAHGSLQPDLRAEADTAPIDIYALLSHIAPSPVGEWVGNAHECIRSSRGRAHREIYLKAAEDHRGAPAECMRYPCFSMTRHMRRLAHAAAKQAKEYGPAATSLGTAMWRQLVLSPASSSR